jgi:8-amino-7-oxononanoate synthase
VDRRVLPQRAQVGRLRLEEVDAGTVAAGCDTAGVSVRTGDSVFDWIDTRAEARAKAGLARRVRPRPADSTDLDLASNDYLGLARDKRVTGAAAAASLRWGAGSTGSRLVTGSTELHTELEYELANFCGAQSALVFSSGYAANLGALTALSGPGTAIVADQHIHASLIDGTRLSKADVVVAGHCDVDQVTHALATRGKRRALVVTDSVFSVDGDLAPLAELHAVCRSHGALLVVDEAHAVGVIGDEGRGAAHQAGLAGEPDVVVTATLSKSLGAQGGAVLGAAVVVEHLVNIARSFIFDTGLAPAAAGAAAAALGVLRADPALAKAVRARAAGLSADLVAAGMRATTPEGAVVSVLVGDARKAADAAAAALDEGVRVGCFRPPSVPDGVSRLRLTARADLTDEEAARAVAVVAGVLTP